VDLLEPLNAMLETKMQQRWKKQDVNVQT
jgi:hypothetical protein